MLMNELKDINTITLFFRWRNRNSEQLNICPNSFHYQSQCTAPPPQDTLASCGGFFTAFFFFNCSHKEVKLTGKLSSDCAPPFFFCRGEEFWIPEAGFCALMKSTWLRGSVIAHRHAFGGDLLLPLPLTTLSYVPRVGKEGESQCCMQTWSQRQQIGPLPVHRQVLMSQVTLCFIFVLIWANILKIKQFPTKLDLCCLLKL